MPGHRAYTTVSVGIESMPREAESQSEFESKASIEPNYNQPLRGGQRTAGGDPITHGMVAKPGGYDRQTRTEASSDVLPCDGCSKDF